MYNMQLKDDSIISHERSNSLLLQFTKTDVYHRNEKLDLRTDKTLQDGLVPYRINSLSKIDNENYTEKRKKHVKILNQSGLLGEIDS